MLRAPQQQRAHLLLPSSNIAFQCLAKVYHSSMELPTDAFVRSVPGDNDVIAFTFPFDLEEKALAESNDPDILEDGDLIISGFAAEFEGQDRSNENFTDGAFQRGIKSFLSGSAPLVWHHKGDKILGKILELEEVPGRGLRMRARIDGAIKNHPELGVIYAQIRKGTISGLSAGGFWKRKMTSAGRKIVDTDLTEISCTALPCHSKPAFAVIAGKALEVGDDSDGPIGNSATEEEPEINEATLKAMSDSLTTLLNTFDSVGGKAVKGHPQDLHFLGHAMNVAALADTLPNSAETEGELGEGGGPTHPKVDELMTNMKNDLHKHGRDAHKLAAKLGPVPPPHYS